MSTAVKLNQWEQEALANKLVALNKKLVMQGHKPISTESQIVHEVLKITLSKISVNNDGQFILETD